ncbi:MAG TPA: DCC1-like thiol-disulfide oxidoreductase family protein [Candidatus Dormibacteraeota bacterium]|nr:DCC1-like thiol-disulfide oxidoreductase family protein [Candidatus Dormibacteraeota bacterium]
MEHGAEGSSGGSHPLLLYDGVCGLCNRAVQFILRHDPDGTFRFASLQSGLAARIFTRHGANPSDLDTAYIVLNLDVPASEGQTGEALLARSDAVLFVMRQLGGGWGAGGWAFGLLPHAARDWAYGVVARRRYRIFGRYDTCPLPDAATRARFLDI